MSDPSSKNKDINEDLLTIEPVILNDNLNIDINSTSVPMTIAKTTGSIIYNTATSNVGRKAIFVGTLYFAGEAIIATFGLSPIIAAGTLLWML